MVVIVTSCASCHVRAPCTFLPNKILSTREPYPYINVTRVSSSEEHSRVQYAS